MGFHIRRVDTLEAEETMNGMDESQLAGQIEGMKDDPDAWGEPDAEPERPIRSERRQRGSVVSVRLSLDELARVQAYADGRHLSLSGVLRTATLEAAELATRTVTSTRWIGSPAVRNVNLDAPEVTMDVRSNYSQRTG